jgi:hypothetical protein
MLYFTQRLKDTVRTTSLWAKLAAIFSFVTTAYFVVTNIARGGFFQIFLLLGVGAIYIVMAVYLFNFGSRTKKGLENIDQGELEDGFDNLRMYFKICTRIVIGFGVLFLLIILFRLLGTGRLA